MNTGLMSRKVKSTHEESETERVENGKGDGKQGEKGLGKAGGRDIGKRKGSRRKRMQMEQHDGGSFEKTVEGADDLMWIDGVQGRANKNRLAEGLLGGREGEVPSRENKG